MDTDITPSDSACHQQGIDSEVLLRVFTTQNQSVSLPTQYRSAGIRLDVAIIATHTRYNT